MLWYVAAISLLNLGLGYAFAKYTNGGASLPIELDMGD